MKRLLRQFPLFSSSTCWLPCFPGPRRAARIFHHKRRSLRHFRRNCCQRYFFRDCCRIHLGFPLSARYTDTGQSCYRKADPYPCNHSDHTGTRFCPHEKSRLRRQKKSSLKDFPDVYSLLCAGFRHHNNRNFSRCFRIRIFSSQNTEQVLHRPRHVPGRFKYKHRKTHQNRRETARPGLLLLGRHRFHEPAHAACAGNLVRYSVARGMMRAARRKLYAMRFAQHRFVRFFKVLFRVLLLSSIF